MGIRLQRLEGPATSLSPGQWTDGENTASGLVALCCRDCHEIHDVPEEFMPPKDDRGRFKTDRLKYVWKCPNEACAFVDFVTLGDFLEGL